MARYSIRCFNYFDGGVTVAMFGASVEDPTINWSLAHIKKFGDQEKKEHEGTVKRMCHIFSQTPLEHVYAPHPVHFNSEIVTTKDFVGGADAIPFGSTIVHRGVYADGVMFNRNERNVGFIMSSADCALIVVQSVGKYFVAHAGRDSLYDKELLATKIKSKEHASIVDAIMEKIEERHRSISRVFVGCAISAGPHFAHPSTDQTHGARNQKMLSHFANTCFSESDRKKLGDAYWKGGHIDLKDIIRRQFLHYGVSNKNIFVDSDEECTFKSSDKYGNPHWHSERREQGKGKRNLVLVYPNFAR
jgi:copper oxidase (laccase) domain-containing protein